MDKKNYLNTLKSIDLRPDRYKVKEHKPVILNEQGNNGMEEQKLLELFVQAGEIKSLPPGAERDTQILRIGMIAELDAVNFYNQLAELANDKRVAKLMLDISHEEKVHAEEFETLLVELDSSYEKAEEEGENEIEDLFGI